MSKLLCLVRSKRQPSSNFNLFLLFCPTDGMNLFYFLKLYFFDSTLVILRPRELLPHTMLNFVFIIKIVLTSLPTESAGVFCMPTMVYGNTASNTRGYSGSQTFTFKDQRRSHQI